jgi:hypothetical protein
MNIKHFKPLLLILLPVVAGCTVEAGAAPAAVEPAQASAGGSGVVEGPEAQPSTQAGQPITCGANDDVNLAGITVDAGGGSAIIASGNCTLNIDGCNLTGGSISGTQAAVVAT